MPKRVDQLKKIDLYRRLARRPNGASERLKVAVLSFDEIHTGCARLRLVDPLMRLPETELSWAVRTAGKSGVIKERTLEAADLLVVQRLFPAPGTVPQIEKIFQMGKPVVFEMDDLLIEVPASNPNYEFAMMCRPYVLDVISRVLRGHDLHGGPKIATAALELQHLRTTEFD